MILHLIKSKKGFEKFKSYTVSDEEIVVLVQDAVFCDLKSAYVADEDAQERGVITTNKISYKDICKKIIESHKVMVW